MTTEEVKKNAGAYIQELLHSASYGPGTPLGTSQYAEPEEIASITREQAQGYLEATHTPDRMVLAASGVDHDAMVGLAKDKFGDMARSSSSGVLATSLLEPSTEYHGGVAGGGFVEEVQLGPPMVHVAFAFPAVGWANSEVIATCLLDTLAGGGASFSAGGPGKGMYTRFYREILA